MGHTYKLRTTYFECRTYLLDIKASLRVFAAQEKLCYDTRLTKQGRRDLESKLLVLRSKVENQSLIKNYNLSQFINDMNATLQTISVFTLKQTSENVFVAYLFDYFWKIVQVKMALMVRQLNFKATKDLRERAAAADYELAKQRQKYEVEISMLKKTIEE